MIHGILESLLPRGGLDLDWTPKDGRISLAAYEAVDQLLKAAEDLSDLLFQEDKKYWEAKRGLEVLKDRRRVIENRYWGRRGFQPLDPSGEDISERIMERMLEPMEEARVREDLKVDKAYVKAGDEIAALEIRLRERGFGISILLPSEANWLLADVHGGDGEL